MNGIVAEWIEKAEGDYRTAEREMRVRKAPNYDAVCFHAQQCAEKYLKAFLAHHQLPEVTLRAAVDRLHIRKSDTFGLFHTGILTI